MLLILKFNKVTPKRQLERAGYFQREWKDWVRKTDDGRWHLHKLEKGVYSIHFDLNTETGHYAPSMPLKTRREVKRINSYSYNTRKYVTRDKMLEIVHKYRDR